MSLKQKAISGMIWNAVERFGSTLFLFISNLVLARLLSPEDFGAIGMLMVFIALSQAIIDGGFGAALIQKKEPTQADYSTIFFWNIGLSVVLYITLYFCAPAIASFYEMPTLVELLRVLGVILILNALFLIQNNVLKKSINFKKIAKVNLLAIVIGTILGIVAAFNGYGVWSLVIKTVSTSILQCIIFWSYGKWRPKFIFCWGAFKSLFKFGCFMFLQSIANSIYLNSLNLIIGKLFSSSSLGYFTQSRKLADISRSTISSVVNNVTLPLFSELQDDKVILKSHLREIIRGVAFLCFPLMALIIVIAKPLIIMLLTTKWEASIPLLQILCIHGAIFFMYELSSNVLLAIGKSKLFFKIRVFQTIIGIILILLGSLLGLNYVVWGYTLSAIIIYGITALIISKELNYRLIEQFKDLYIFVILSIISGFSAYMIKYLEVQLNCFTTIIIQLSIFILLYINLNLLLHKLNLNVLNFNNFHKIK